MQISNLPSTTTFDNNTVIAVENSSGSSNITYKMTGQSLRTGLAADTGWNLLSLNSGVLGTILYRARNGVLYIIGQSIETLNNVSIVAGTIPSDYRPTMRIAVKPSRLLNYNDSIYIEFNSNASGDIQIVNEPGISIRNLWFETSIPIG